MVNHYWPSLITSDLWLLVIITGCDWFIIGHRRSFLVIIDGPDGPGSCLLVIDHLYIWLFPYIHFDHARIMQFTPSFVTPSPVVIAGGRTPQVHACLPSCPSNSRVHWPKPLRLQPLRRPRPWRRRSSSKLHWTQTWGTKDQKGTSTGWFFKFLMGMERLIADQADVFVEHIFGDPCTWQGQGCWVWGAMAKPTSIAKERQCQPSEMSLGCMAPDIWSFSTPVFIVKTVGFEMSCQPHWLAFRRLGFKCLKWFSVYNSCTLIYRLHVSSQNIEHRFFLASF